MGFLGLGDNTKSQLKKLEKIAAKIEALDGYMQGLGDDALRNKTEEFKERYKSGKEDLDDLLPEAFAASSTLSKCSGIFAWVSKLSMQLNIDAIAGVCTGRSVAEPPQIIITSILSVIFFASSASITGTPAVRSFTVSGGRRVKTAQSSISGF